MASLSSDGADFARRVSDPEAVVSEAAAVGIDLSKVATRDVELALWSVGARPEAQPILLLHGVTYSSLSVFDLATPDAPREAYSPMLTLARAGFAVYALDAEGYGLSPIRPGGSSLADCAGDIGAAIETIRRPHRGARVALVGWSWGAQLAARYLSHDAPDAPISHLVFWGSCWGGGPSGPPAALRGLSPPPTARRVNTPEHARADFRTPSTYAPSVRDAFARQALRLDPTSPTLGLHAVARSLPLHEPARIRVPTLAIHGEYDPMASPADLRDWLFRIDGPSSSYRVIAGADHNAQFSRARGALLQEIATFIRL
ncbi:MAG: lysophospholipase [Microvirga sp.]|nr:lysophospholipase [Microvirga sp.]